MMLGGAVGGYFLRLPHTASPKTRREPLPESAQSPSLESSDRLGAALAGIERRLELLELKQGVSAASSAAKSPEPENELAREEHLQTIQDREQALHAQQAAQVADFENRLITETRDRSWAMGAESNLRHAAESASSKDMQLEVDSADCRTTVCRVVVSATSRSDGVPLQTALPFFAEGMSSYTVTLPTKTADGAYKFQYDFVRESSPEPVAGK